MFLWAQSIHARFREPGARGIHLGNHRAPYSDFQNRKRSRQSICGQGNGSAQGARVCVAVRGIQHQERGNSVPDLSFLNEVAEFEVSLLSNTKR